jgi:glyoxylase I family protein
MLDLKILGLDHVVLRTERLDDVLSFYCDKLGLVLERELREIGLYQLRAGTALVDIVDGSVWKAKGAGGESHYDHFCLQIAGEDADGLSRQLDEHGIDHGAPAPRYGATGDGLSIYATDPDGRTVELKLVPRGQEN